MPKAGIEPARGKAPLDFESSASPSSATSARLDMIAPRGLNTPVAGANRGYVLETGTIALADDAKALRQNERVRKTYLGEE